MRLRLKVIKMVFVVSLMYIVCWLFNLVLYMLFKYELEVYVYGLVFYIILVVFVGVNLVINFFIYVFYSSNFC